ncbi:Heterokaryon incompatibility protein 6 OR allele [Apiospora arundinis]|uniref:Heterokaryon incompatibility protein 6 OR allele n=1 Tax=Apiospora arundinis TaxID=335852 RepID=A0ABR2HPA9_9PEZI
MESNLYPYEPLCGDEFRFLAVQPFDESVGVVECTLHQVPLRDASGIFTALSYAWGDASATETIRLNGHPFEVTTNLDACLRQLATNPEQRQTCLWVDAICINQHDVEERNIQVRRMKEIYSTAGMVIAWLGPATARSRIGMQRLQNISPSDIEGIFSEQQDKTRMARVYDEVLQGDGLDAIEDLVQRPYWRRTWVVQEIILGRRNRLLCGDDMIALENFSALYWLFCEHFLSAVASGEDHFPILYRFTTKLARNRVSSILEYERSIPQKIAPLVREFQHSECSDARDKIYGLLGICDQSEVHGIIPDYNRPVTKVYGDFAETHIRSLDNLEIMGYIRFNINKDPSDPSWIPDWRLSNTPSLLAKLHYAASNNLSLSSHPWSLDRNTERLDLTGACLDTITTLGTEMRFNPDSACWHDEVLDSAIISIKLVYRALTGRPSENESTSMILQGADVSTYSLNDGEPLDQACRRTLVASGEYTPGLYSEQCPFMMLLPGEEGRQRADGSVYTYDDTVWRCMITLHCRRLAITSKGWIGVVPEATEIGDHVAVLIGASTPFILRKAPAGGMPDVGEERLDKTVRTGDEFLPIGEAYIHGLMFGRGLELAELTKITLV